MAVRQAADMLDREVGAIVDRWVDRIRQTIYERRRDLNCRDLVDNAPDMVRGLAEALRRGDPEDLKAPWTTAAREHAVLRRDRRITIGEMVREYQMLREEIWITLRRHLSAISTDDLYNLGHDLHAALDTMATIATDTYGAELERSEERFRLIVAHSPDIMFFQDRELRYTWIFNPAPPVTVEQVLGKTDFDLLPHDQAERLEKVKKKVLQTGVSTRVELELSPGGISRWYETVYEPLLGSEGKTVGVAGYSRDITERKRAEEALRESEEKYRTLFNSIDEGFCIIEVLFDENEKPIDYRFLEANPAFEKQTGLYEAKGRLVRELVPEHEEHWFETYGRIALTGKPERFENEAKALGRWYDVYAFRFGKPESRQVAILFNDITNRKQTGVERERLLEQVREINSRLAMTSIQAREQAEEAERRAAEMDATLAAITSGIVIYGPDRSVLRLNAAAERILGFTKEEWDSMSYPERVRVVRMSTEDGKIIPPDQTPMSLALRGQSFPEYRLTITGRDGTSRHIVVSAAPIRDRQGQAQRRAAELSATIVSMAEGVAVYGPNGKLILLNPAFDAILGYTAEQRELPLAERVKLMRLNTTEGKLPPLKELPPMRALRGETVHGQAFVFQRPDGKIVWISVSAAPILVGGKAKGAVVTFTDITEMHNLQERREDILRTVSHDLRSPLTIIQGQAQLLLRALEKAGLTGTEMRSAEAIVTSAKRMNTMISDLVDVERLGAGELRLRKQPVNLRAFVDELLQRAKGVMAVERVKVEIPPDLPPASADPDRLERIFTNLLSNALKYSPSETDACAGN